MRCTGRPVQRVECCGRLQSRGDYNYAVGHFAIVVVGSISAPFSRNSEYCSPSRTISSIRVREIRSFQFISEGERTISKVFNLGCITTPLQKVAKHRGVHIVTLHYEGLIHGACTTVEKSLVWSTRGALR
jgi:hypothetical protein